MKLYNPFLIVFFLLPFSLNAVFCQESILKDEFDLSIYFTTSEEGDSLLAFKIINNSSDSIRLFPPDNGSSMIVYVLPDQEELESSIISCGPSVDLSMILPPNETKIFTIPVEHYQIMLNPYREKFGYNATYEIYWKVYDGRFIEETVYGKKGRFRIDRKPTYLRSNSISVKH